MFLSHKIRLYPNNKQESHLIRACGIKRFAYNWALAESKSLYEQGIKTSGYDLSKRFNAIKKEKFPFVSEVSKWVPQKAIYDVYEAYNNWWKKRTRRPRFKKRGRCRDSFYLGLNSFSVKENKIRIPLLGHVRMTQPLRFPGRPLSVVIGRDHGKWYASVQVEVNDSEFVYSHACKTHAVCGVDLGVVDLAVLDDGQRFPAPRSFRVLARKLRRCNKRVSRRIPKSNRRRKAVRALGRVYEQAFNVRKNATNTLTAFLIRNYSLIGVESLDVKRMLKNKWLSKSISDSAFGEIIRQLEYKTQLAGSVLVKADKFFPSTKTCSDCGAELESLPLNVRTWTCPMCDSKHDRDVNAAINLRNVAVRYTETENARGDCVRPRKRQRSSKRESGNLLTDEVRV